MLGSTRYAVNVDLGELNPIHFRCGCVPVTILITEPLTPPDNTTIGGGGLVTCTVASTAIPHRPALLANSSLPLAHAGAFA
jgi:hypothetical protein